jgi:hypothetical protein
MGINRPKSEVKTMNGLVSQDMLDELHAKGSAVYERLRQSLESEHWNRFVAIHVDSGDYAVGKTAGEASRRLRALRQPDGRMFLRKIGNEPEYELSARILDGEMEARKPK